MKDGKLPTQPRLILNLQNITIQKSKLNIRDTNYDK